MFVEIKKVQNCISDNVIKLEIYLSSVSSVTPIGHFTHLTKTINIHQ